MEAGKKNLKTRWEKLRSDVQKRRDTLKASMPNIDKLKQDYKKQLDDMWEEMQSDKTIRDIFEF